MQYGMPALIENSTLEKNILLCKEDSAIHLTERLALVKACHARCVLETKTIKALGRSVQWMRENCIYEA